MDGQEKAEWKLGPWQNLASRQANLGQDKCNFIDLKLLVLILSILIPASPIDE